MLDRVAGIISRYSMIAPGQRVGVAVSGGADSVCLLYLLRELAPARNLLLTVVHLNHKLRADESDNDEEFVRNLACELGYPTALRSENVGEAGDNLEQAGREARRRFYRELITSGHVDVVATGHTRSDQAETVLYRILRGSGTTGLSGIRPVTEDGIVRPLLDCNREEIETYLKERGIPWRTDTSNQDRSFVRNQIRHDLLPQLQKEYNPVLPKILAQMARVAQDEERFWDKRLKELATGLLQVHGETVEVACSRLLAIPVAEARRLLRRAIEIVKGDLRSIDFEHVEALLALIGGGEGHGRLQLPGLDVFRSFDWLRIALPRRGPRADRDYTFSVAPPMEIKIPGGFSTISVDLIDFSGGCPVEAGETGYNEGGLLDLESITEPLELRNWRPGDRYVRPGRSSEKIKFLFQDGRVPIWERQGWPVLTSGGRIVWVRKFGASAEVSPSTNTYRVIRVREIADIGVRDGA